MARDRFDGILIAALVVTLAGLGWLVAGSPTSGGAAAGPVDRNLERAMAAQARLAFLDKVYAPVVQLQEAGRDQEALLKLGELDRSYPGEPHGDILRAASLQRLGALQEAVAAAVRAVRRNGDYVAENSPFSQRELIRRLVAAGLEKVAPQAAGEPGNAALGRTLKDVYYLQSRLAGGCE